MNLRFVIAEQGFSSLGPSTPPQNPIFTFPLLSWCPVHLMVMLFIYLILSDKEDYVKRLDP